MAMSNCVRPAALWPLAAASALAVFVLSARAAEETKAADQPAQTAIRASAEAFIQAFNRGDAKALAALWTESGTMADGGGRIIKGRKAIEDRYAAFFRERPESRIEIAVQSIDLPAADVAIEDGLARVVAKGEASPSAARYTAVHVLTGGKWLMASVREANVDIPSSFARIEQLQSLVGTWETHSGDVAVQTTIRWIANRSFLQREYTVRKGALTTSSGVQIIGWDPQSRQVRSWSFDASGGHGAGLWTPTPQGWRIQSSGVLADGIPTSSQDFIIRVAGDDDVLGWRSERRKAGATELPDTPEIVLKRVSEKH